MEQKQKQKQVQIKSPKLLPPGLTIWDYKKEYDKYLALVCYNCQKILDAPKTNKWEYEKRSWASVTKDNLRQMLEVVSKCNTCISILPMFQETVDKQLDELDKLDVTQPNLQCFNYDPKIAEMNYGVSLVQSFYEEMEGIAKRIRSGCILKDDIDAILTIERRIKMQQRLTHDNELCEMLKEGGIVQQWISCFEAAGLINRDSY